MSLESAWLATHLDIVHGWDACIWDLAYTINHSPNSRRIGWLDCTDSYTYFDVYKLVEAWNSTAECQQQVNDWAAQADVTFVTVFIVGLKTACCAAARALMTSSKLFPFTGNVYTSHVQLPTQNDKRSGIHEKAS